MFNPFEQKPILLGEAIADWNSLYPKATTNIRRIPTRVRNPDEWH